MSKCPFWSNSREKIECYSECPIFGSELTQGEGSEKCIFHDCSDVSDISFKESMKEEYNFLNVSMYESEKYLNMNF
ncbi:hypothetical protein [Clostridium saccharoperbutylacetonicum]|jgi:hypothetical protein